MVVAVFDNGSYGVFLLRLGIVNFTLVRGYDLRQEAMEDTD